MIAAAMAGLQVAGGVMGYMNAKADAKYQQKLVEYQRSVNMANYVIKSQAVQRNHVQELENEAASAVSIQQQHLIDKGAATVSAAAVGASGNSVGQSLALIDQAEAKARYNLDINAKYAAFNYGNSLASIEMEKAGAFIPDAVEPDMLTALFGTASSAANAYMVASK